MVVGFRIDSLSPKTLFYSLSSHRSTGVTIERLRWRAHSYGRSSTRGVHCATD